MELSLSYAKGYSNGEYCLHQECPPKVIIFYVIIATVSRNQSELQFCELGKSRVYQYQYNVPH